MGHVLKLQKHHYQSIKLNLELTPSPVLMCNISEKGRLGAIQDLILIRLRLYPNLPEETPSPITKLVSPSCKSVNYKMTKNVNLHHIAVFTSFRSQESKVLSIIKHRGAPRRSLGNYKKISLPSYLRGAPLCLIIDRTSDSCVPIVLRKHTLYNIRYLSFE